MEIGAVQFLSRWAFLDFLQLGRVAGAICIWFLHFLDTFLKWPVGRPQSHSWAWVFTWLGSAPCPKITGSWQGFPSSPGKRNWQEEHQCPLVSDGPLPGQLSKQLSQSWGRGDTGKSGVDSSLYTLVQWLIAFLCPWGDRSHSNRLRNKPLSSGLRCLHCIINICPQFCSWANVFLKYPLYCLTCGKHSINARFPGEFHIWWTIETSSRNL